MSVGIEEICRVLAGHGNPPLTPERVRQLVNEGMEKDGHGKYDAVRCMFWYLGKVRRMVSHKETENDDGSSSGIRGERRRLLSAQADTAEMELAKARAETISMEDHVRILSELVQETKGRMMSIPARAAADVVGETSRVMVQAKIEKRVREAMAHLAEKSPKPATEVEKPKREVKPKPKKEEKPKVKKKPTRRKPVSR
jgi:phage terminase Nu1 subunit (DNA packaging protein)